MFKTQATLETQTASRYITRLCKHWRHRFNVDFDEQRGHINFGGSSCVLQASDTALNITLVAPEAELGELELVVADHIQRFAPRGEELRFAWVRITATDPERNEEEKGS